MKLTHVPIEGRLQSGLHHFHLYDSEVKASSIQKGQKFWHKVAFWNWHVRGGLSQAARYQCWKLGS